MAPRSDYLTGTISLTNGQVAFTGTGTGWLAAGFKEGDVIIDVTGATEFMGVIATVTAAGAGTLTKAWEGPTLVDVDYRMRYQPDGARVTAQARELIELLGNGNLAALAGLDGVANAVPIFTAPGAMTLIQKSELVNGVAFNARVPNLAGRAAYDDRPGPTDDTPGYSVLVEDNGDGRAALYTKNSDTSADWSDAAFITGETGSPPTLDNVTVTPVDWDDPASGAFTETTPGVYDLDLDLPKARGYNHRGAYSGATAYAVDDSVIYGGATWRAKIATTGNTPPTLPTTSNTQWELVAGAQGYNHRGDYSGATAYEPNDTVLYDGSSWRAKIATTGNAPPLLPTTSNTQWELVAGARGFNHRGDYSGATAYEIDDTVLYNGSTWRALQATTGNAPPNLPTTSNANWTLVARAGVDGTGTGDVVGPAGATDERIAVYDGPTGKLLKEGTKTVANLVGLSIAAAIVLS